MAVEAWAFRQSRNPFARQGIQGQIDGGGGKGGGLPPARPGASSLELIAVLGDVGHSVTLKCVKYKSSISQVVCQASGLDVDSLGAEP